MARGNNKRANMLGTFIIAAIGYIVLGVFMVIHPDKTASGIRVMFGVIMLMYGIVNIVSFFLNKDSEENLFLELASAVIAMALGVFVLVADAVLINSILFYTMGVIVIIDGLVNAKRAFNLKSCGMRYWFIVLIAAALTVIAGILCIVFKDMLASIIVVIIGCVLIYEGIVSLVTMFLVARMKKKVEKELALAQQENV